MKNKLIAFFGIDGCGKTTLIGEIKSKLEKDSEDVKIIYMGLGNEFNFPGLKQIMRFLSFIKQRDKKSEKALRKYNFRERSFFWVLGQYSEFWLRYRKAKKQSKNSVILFDRFFYDGLILGSPLAYKFFRHFTPIPDKSFLIHAPAKTVYERKGEADIEDIKKYYSKSEKLLLNFPIIKIDNSKELKKVVNTIYNEIKNEK